MVCILYFDIEKVDLPILRAWVAGTTTGEELNSSSFQ